MPWGAGEVRGALGVDLAQERVPVPAGRDARDELDRSTFRSARSPRRTSSARPSVKEVYGELLVPLLKNVPRREEPRARARLPLLRLRHRRQGADVEGASSATRRSISCTSRGGVQVANRAPNINELFLDSSSQAVTLRAADYCRCGYDGRRSATSSANPNRAKVQALCSALDRQPGSAFDIDPNKYTGGRGDGVILQTSQRQRKR